MKVYLAAGFSRKNEIADKAVELMNLGIIVTSTWTAEEAKPTSQLNDVTDEYLLFNGKRDLDEIVACDALVLFTQDPTKPFVRGGRMHEAGFAVGLGKRLYICGPRENIFHWQPNIMRCDTWDEMKQTLVTDARVPAAEKSEARKHIGTGGAPTRATNLPENAEARKKYPVASGVLDYFPDAIAAISHVSWAGNNQHNPGKPLHWARNKSKDEADTMLRHFLQRGTVDIDGLRHTAKMAWRALALLQKEIESDN